MLSQLLHHKTCISLAKWLLFIYFLFVCYLCLSPVDQQPSIHIWDKAAHTLAYIGFSGLSCICTINRSNYYGALLAFFFYGILIEIIQGVIGYRSFSYLDMFANSTGIILGLLITLFINHFIRLPGLARS